MGRGPAVSRILITLMSSTAIPAASVDSRLEIPEGVCVLTYSHLNAEEIVNLVRDDAAGAIATFIGEGLCALVDPILTIPRNHPKFIQRHGQPREMKVELTEPQEKS